MTLSMVADAGNDRPPGSGDFVDRAIFCCVNSFGSLNVARDIRIWQRYAIWMLWREKGRCDSPELLNRVPVDRRRHLLSFRQSPQRA